MVYLKVHLLFGFLIALVLSILPMPDFLSGLRPPWVLLFVLYIQFFMPQYFNVTLLFFIGLCLDVLLSTTLGEHAFALLGTTWLASGRARRFNFFPMGQQMLLVFLFCLIYQLVIILMDAFLGYHYEWLMVVSSAVISLFLWPWIKVLADSTLSIKVSSR